MTATTSTTRYFEAITDAQTALMDAARTAGTSQLAISQRLLTEMQAAQKRNLALIRRVSEQPSDLGGNVAHFIEASGEAQAQALGMARLLIESAPEARGQFDRLVKANQQVAQATFAAMRDLYTENPFLQAYRTAAATAAPAATEPAPTVVTAKR